MPPSQIILLNGVYGAPEHFDALRAAFAPIPTEVFCFRREGELDPDPKRAFDPMVRRLDRLIDARGPVADGASAPVLIGFSLGGALALEYALHRPDRLSALILVNAFDRFQLGPFRAGSMPPLWRWAIQMRHRPHVARMVHGMAWLRRGLFHSDASLEVVEKGMEAAIASVTLDDLRFQLAHLGLPFPPGQAERLAGLPSRLPVLLINSRDDLVVPPFHTARLAAAMPAATCLPPFEGGHAFFQHDGRVLAKAVLRFLDDAATRRNGVRESA
jgi:pimeloyl-ACP methyl ester carboxylesterase